MNFFDDWKPLWPISSVFSAPLLLNNDDDDSLDVDSNLASSQSKTKTKQKIGPLVFHPLPITLIQLFSSPSFSPQLPAPYPAVPLPRFLETFTPVSSILPSTCNSIAKECDYPSILGDNGIEYNRLQLLRCPGAQSVLAFFPTGNNSDQIGFLILSVEDTSLLASGAGCGRVFLAGEKLQHRITKFLVNPLSDFGSSSNSGDYCFYIIGYLLVCTMYSVSWYCVKIRRSEASSKISVRVDFVGSKLFKSCAVIHACWSPHLPKECVVLLENGELYMIDLNAYSNTKDEGFGINFLGTKLKVEWFDQNTLERDQWLSCEISWHPRILIVAHSKAVFLVDARSEKCNVNCLLKIDMLRIGNPIKEFKKDEFIAFARASSDGFYFVVASKGILLICDVRKPMMPVVQWSHGLDDPRYVTVYKLSDLRSNPKDDSYRWASDSGYCIFLGSFCTCEFNLFCYGPNTRGGLALEISKVRRSLYAWELPFELLLSGRGCDCGDCLVREEFAKDTIPKWIDWRQKKDIVLGFGILDKEISNLLFEPHGCGGFSLIRIMSSGKLEAQRYCSSRETINISSETHNDQPLLFEDSLLYALDDNEYKMTKFQYLKLDRLENHLGSSLDVTSVKRTSDDIVGKNKFEVLFSDCNQVVSLADDTEEILNGSHEAKLASSDKHSQNNNETFILKNCQTSVLNKNANGLELFDSLCPVNLKFQDHAIRLEPKEVDALTKLARQWSKFQEGFDLYQDYIANANFPQNGS